MAQKFDNNSSDCLFIGNRNLDEVIAQDSRELAEISGSFEAIADRMEELVDWAKEKGDIINYEELCELIDPLHSAFEKRHGNNFHENPDVWELYRRK